MTQAEIIALAARTRLLLMDVDGVLTDGRLYNVPGPDGKMAETKGFDSQDGIALQWLSWYGIKTGVISGRVSPATEERARQTKMSYVYQGHIEKIPILEEIMNDESHKISRRKFTALSIAAGAAAATGISAASAAAASVSGVTESDVQVPTPSGVCDAALVHPQGKGRWPGVILFVDAFGLRRAMRDMAKRLAAGGYTVLVPNPYYRSTKAPGIGPGFDFTNPADRAKSLE